MTGRDDDFYVGYVPRASRSTGRFAGTVTGLLLASGLAVAVILASIQHRPAPSAFEFGVLRPWSGVVRERPYPMLVVPVPGAGGRASMYLLAGYGKRGAAELVQDRDGMVMHVEGSLIYRGPHTMVEVLSTPTFSPISPGSRPDTAANREPHEVEVAGEIVDSKCHLGAMNPGDGPTHRLCATRCLRGGLPPLLAREDGSTVLLAGSDGEPAGEEILPHVGLPVRIRGRLRLEGSWRILEADLSTITPAVQR